MNVSNKNFYGNLPEIIRFTDILDLQYYAEIPGDWLIVATDIRGSTKAIHDGKYKSVNMAGACAIAAICNEFSDLDIPFVFGGDGATFAIPDVGKEHIMGLLLFCREATDSVFGLELAAGCRKMSELRDAGKNIKIGKYRLSNHIQQAIFWGDGVDYIEELIKEQDNNFLNYQMIEADFTGLECRWNEIPSDKGEILSIIIKSVISDENEKSTFYKRCFATIESIYGSADEYAPVKEDKLKLAGNPFKLSVEALIRSYPATYTKKLWHYLKLYYMQIAGRFLIKKRIKTKHTNWGDYKKDFVQNADFRKFSDGLKLVVSGNEKQRLKLRAFLEDEHQKGNVVFGLHKSPAAMTTCFVTDYQGQHIHFIDGTNGGYAAASVELKKQLNRLKE
ncbi:DUF3095 domain-containing protein [Rhodohalobacter sp. SW132]|uniref:DUF3095 domain-containing protein n=1 Tax=Rhodohalobacter sp. SW132 TaxID=2293433 RepID=UPI000E24DF18|nr:DUF3095 domain-containing protein [Rhodohalobacter sp. SW132]REL38184.1 DUF3095 domain-containing protein [Rhodohalobacter sp. SW132]